jgi:tRNA (guanine37-N1)-methyltransferase
MIVGGSHSSLTGPAHLNLRAPYIPYKHIIAQVLLDKNPVIRTVINKVDNVGAESEFRTFQYELLAGPDDMHVQVNENHCTFEFDYSKVYWNSKLEHEHRRLVNIFQPGQVVCDVMAGIGPFAVPAGKNRVFVWANDKNPESYKYLVDGIRKNKVSEFVRPFCEDGRDFICRAADEVLEASRKGECAVLPIKVPRSQQQRSRSKSPTGRKQPPKPKEERIPIPPTISHFVMNLPASAIDFLPSYRGLYHGHEDLFHPATSTRLPMIHVHCFGPKADDETPALDVCERISLTLGVRARPAKEGEDPAEAEDRVGEDGVPEVVVGVHLVRAVAPAKSMYCASFRLPAKVAFATRA